MGNANELPRALRRDLKILAQFVRIYCDHRHPQSEKEPLHLRTHDVAAIAGREVVLCANCRKLLAHAFVKRTGCPLDPKPACRRCPAHCYLPKYRAAIREVMRYSGTKLVLSGRLDYLYHLLF
jgi:hypothetical protein